MFELTPLPNVPVAISDSYQNDARYLHPKISAQLPEILNTIQTKLPAGYDAKLISGYRSPEDQFKLFRIGRTFKKGTWTKTGEVVTHKDGYINTSRHNFLPSVAIDIGLYKDSIFLNESPLYHHVSVGKSMGFIWGGEFQGNTDEAHLELDPQVCFKGNIEKDSAYLWQLYLKMAGTYKSELDGIFGVAALEALYAATGHTDRIMQAWDYLYNKFGPLTE